MTRIYYCHYLLLLFYCFIGYQRISAQTANKKIDTKSGFRLERFDGEVEDQSTAQAACEKTVDFFYQGWLARIKDDTLQEYVSNLTRSSTSGKFYIGLEYDNRWYWNDGTELADALKKYWASDEGDTEDENCACVRGSDGMWLDVACDKRNSYVCQSELIYIQLNGEELTTALEGDNVTIKSFVVTRSDAVDIKLYKLSDESMPLKSTSAKATDKTGVVIEYTIDSLVANRDSGEYVFKASTQNEPFYSRSVKTTIDVHVPVDIVGIYPLSITSPVTNGSSYVNCTAYGNPTPTVKWTKQGSDVVNLTVDAVYQEILGAMAILHVENAALSDHGKYTCEAENKIYSSETIETDSADIQLQVLGSPIIFNSTGNECNEESKILVCWKPNNQTLNVLHKFEMVNLNNTAKQNITSYVTPQSDCISVTEINNLTQYTTYSVTITVCPDECIDNLNSSSYATTEVGVPDPVTDANVTQTVSSECIVAWKWNDIYPLEKVSFGIQKNSSAYFTSDLEPDHKTETDTLPGNSLKAFSVTTKTEPNRNYTFTVTASTCAGDSNTVEAIGQCITDVGAPNDVEQPQTLAKKVPSIQPIEVIIPSETNGPISCIFVVMVSGTSPTLTTEFSEDVLRQFSDATMSINGSAPADNKEYLAAAIPRDLVNGTKHIVNLGDGNITSCNPNQVNTRRKRDLETYTAENFQLKNDTNYTYYTLTTTPLQLGDGIVFQRSDSNTFEHDYSIGPEEESGESLWWIALIVVGVLLLAGIIVGVIYVQKKKTKKINENSTTESPLSTGYPLMTGTTLAADRNPDVEVKAQPPVRENKQSRHSSTFISEKKLAERFEELNRSHGEGFTNQFTALKKASDKTTTAAMQEAVKKKNRYKNVLPYDDTRVTLSGKKEEERYINACYIDGYRQEKKFIATQGPVSQTVNDFWRMVTEKETQVIVMLTNLEEKGKKKCAQYWPEIGEYSSYGGVKVANENEQHHGGFIVRGLSVTTAGNTRSIQQFQYRKWPDHGVPVTTSSFVRLHKACMKSQGKKKTPIIVHCSAGAGRTGAFIGYDFLLEEIAGKDKGIDVSECVKRMRDQRMDMVQTCDQYKLLHRLLLEYTLVEDADEDGSGLKGKLRNYEKGKNSEIQKEFESLKRLSSISKITDIEGTSFNVVILWAPEDKDSIPRYDASYVQNYYDESKLIASKAPAEFEGSNFWRIVLDNEVKYIVMINDGKEVPYWPQSKNQPVDFGQISVELTKSEDMTRVTERRMILRRSKQVEEVVQYQLLEWTPEAIERVIFKITGAANTAIHSRSNVIVHCSNGRGRTGVFCAMINMFERWKKEVRVDVFRAVKDLRDFRDDMVQDKEQYKFCYQVLDHWLDNNHENAYENHVLTGNLTTTL